MPKTFMCDIWIEKGKGDIELEQILIKAPTVNNALFKLEKKRKYDKCTIVDQTDNRIFAYSELGSCVYHIIIGESTEIIE